MGEGIYLINGLRHLRAFISFREDTA
jgi:hypothetical protein